MTLRFRKMHGLGNDFVVLDGRRAPVAVTPDLARAVGDRRCGVGFDQLVALGAPTSAAADMRVSFYNADGSPSAACGNGSRCAAHLAMAESGAASMVIETDAGLLRAWREADGRVTVDMGPPVFDWRRIPLSREADVDALPLPGAPSAASMGNPHCVFFVTDAASAPVERDGPRFETDPLFPQRANVEFAQVLNRRSVRVRVWERGVGVTRACGTGACAVLVAGVRRGLLDRAATVTLDGGALDIAWAEEGGVLMTGPVADVFEGAFTDEFLRAASAGEAAA